MASDMNEVTPQEEEQESDQDSFNSMAVRVEVEESDKDTASEELPKEFVETFEPLEETEEDCTENEGVMKSHRVIPQDVTSRSSLLTTMTFKDLSGVEDKVSVQVPSSFRHPGTNETRLWIPSRRQCWVLAWCVYCHQMMLQKISSTNC